MCAVRSFSALSLADTFPTAAISLLGPSPWSVGTHAQCRIILVASTRVLTSPRVRVRGLSWPCGSLTDCPPSPRSTFDILSIIVATAVQPPAPPILARSSAVCRHRILRKLPRRRLMPMLHRLTPSIAQARAIRSRASALVVAVVRSYIPSYAQLLDGCRMDVKPASIPTKPKRME